jgi:uncharacterized membrane protein YkvA (DUF1232 family)
MAGRQARVGGPSRRGRSNGRRAVVTGSLAALALVPAVSRAPAYLRLAAELLADARVPAGRKAVFAGVAGYVLSPFDLVPDRIPVFGMLDDIVIAILGLELFLGGVPDELLAAKLADLGIPRAAFDEDRARLRRVIPPPVRRITKSLPGTLDSVARAARGLGAERRFRAWINKEGSLA